MGYGHQSISNLEGFIHQHYRNLLYIVVHYRCLDSCGTYDHTTCFFLIMVHMAVGQSPMPLASVGFDPSQIENRGIADQHPISTWFSYVFTSNYIARSLDHALFSLCALFTGKELLVHISTLLVVAHIWYLVSFRFPRFMRTSPPKH